MFIFFYQFMNNSETFSLDECIGEEPKYQFCCTNSVGRVLEKFGAGDIIETKANNFTN